MDSNIITIKNLHKSFGENNILNGINFKVNKGDVSCIIGPSGSGKSTFLRCINLLDYPHKVRLYIKEKMFLRINMM